MMKTSWKAMVGKIAIGIDVGWSEKRKSCALAIRGCEPDNEPQHWRRYRSKSDAEPVLVGLFQFKGLIAFLADFLDQLQDRLGDVVVVIDGPIGPTGPPRVDRHVDSAFGRGQFHRRMQPSPVTSKDGPRYVDVTSQVVGTFFAAAGAPFFPPWPFVETKDRFVYAETHPTVGLGLLVPPQGVETLPSRKRPFRASNKTYRAKRASNKTYRAKSDWYWRIGACERIAEILEAEVGLETHHERVAGLYCLAVAVALARHLEGSRPAVAALGNDGGTYVIPSELAADWEASVREVGVKAGLLRPERAFSCKAPSVFPVQVLALKAIEAAICTVPDPVYEADAAFQGSDDLDLKGDEQFLILSDNGGVWETQNDWLVGLEGPVCVKTLDSEQTIIRFRRADRGEHSGQWISDDKAKTPLKLAKRRKYAGKHLKKSDSVAIPVQLVESSEEP